MSPRLHGTLATADIQAAGNASLHDLEYDRIKAEGLKFDWVLNRDWLDLKAVQASVGKGRVTGSGRLPLAPKAKGEVDLAVADLEVQDLVKSVPGVKLRLEGRVSGKAKAILDPVGADGQRTATADLDLTAPPARGEFHDPENQSNPRLQRWAGHLSSRRRRAGRQVRPGRQSPCGRSETKQEEHVAPRRHWPRQYAAHGYPSGARRPGTGREKSVVSRRRRAGQAEIGRWQADSHWAKLWGCRAAWCRCAAGSTWTSPSARRPPRGARPRGAASFASIVSSGRTAW